MAVDLHTCGDSSLPYDLNHSNNINISPPPQYLLRKDFESHTLPPLPHSDEAQGRMKKREKDNDLVAELTRQMHMAHFMLQDNHQIDSSTTPSHNLEPLSRITQEKILLLKQKLAAHGDGDMISQLCQFRMKENNYVGFTDGRRIRQQRLRHQQVPQPISTGTTSCSRGTTTSCGGTGVFLPRGTPTPPPLDSTRKSGKGSCKVLIPARVVQALQLQFDQIAATSGSKPPAFPPLHDVLVSNRDGMYSLQKRQLGKKSSHIQNDMILPPEWTY